MHSNIIECYRMLSNIVKIYKKYIYCIECTEKLVKNCLNNLLKYFLKIFYIVFLDDIFFHIKAKNKIVEKALHHF